MVLFVLPFRRPDFRIYFRPNQGRRVKASYYLLAVYWLKEFSNLGCLGSSECAGRTVADFFFSDRRASAPNKAERMNGFVSGSREQKVNLVPRLV